MKPKAIQKVKVMARFRPINEIEKFMDEENAATSDEKTEAIYIDDKSSTVSIGKDGLQKWSFDHVFGSNTSQQEMFNIVGKSMCDDILNGYNATIFVYGGTGSGKTYTLYGDEENPYNVNLQGLIPRCAHYIFSGLKRADSFKVNCSFLEINNEIARDLLSPKQQNDLRFTSNQKKEHFVFGLIQKNVAQTMDLLKLIAFAAKNRSKKSNILMTLKVTMKLSDGTTTTSTANFMDLICSKNITHSLSEIISALSDGLAPHIQMNVPYKDSKLTHVLADSLGGNCKTILIITCSPSKYNKKETIQTMQFGGTCKLVQNTVKQNTIYSNEDLVERVQLLQEKNVMLQDIIRQKVNGQKELDQIKELNEKLNGLMIENDELKNKLSNSQKKSFFQSNIGNSENDQLKEENIKYEKKEKENKLEIDALLIEQERLKKKIKDLEEEKSIILQEKTEILEKEEMDKIQNELNEQQKIKMYNEQNEKIKMLQGKNELLLSDIDELKKDEKNKIKSLEEQIETERASNKYQFDLVQKGFIQKIEILQQKLDAETLKNKSLKNEYDEKEDILSQNKKKEKDLESAIFDQQLKYLESEKGLNYYKEIQIDVDHKIASSMNEEEAEYRRKLEQDLKYARKLQKELDAQNEVNEPENKVNNEPQNEPQNEPENDPQNFLYENELEEILEMGLINDKNIIKNLLNDCKGNKEMVIQTLKLQ